MTLFTRISGLSLARERCTIPAICLAAMSMFVLILMTKTVINYFDLSLTAIRFPFELDYGEGIVWQQAVMIPGKAMYGDITKYPFIVFHYPPLYHLILHFLISLHAPPLIAGRSVSFAASLTIAVCAAAITHHALRETSKWQSQAIGASVAFVAALATWPFEVWSNLMRVDMLSIAFCFLGIICSLKAISNTRRRHVTGLWYVAIVFFFCAVFTKQTSILALIAALPVMFMVAPARAWCGIALGLALGLVAFTSLEILTAGGFLRHILFYNLNRFNLRSFLNASRSVPYHVIFLCLAIYGLSQGWRRSLNLGKHRRWSALCLRLQSDPLARVVLLVSIYFALTTASLVTLAKSGSAFNYLVEWMEVWSIPIGILAAWMTASLFEEAKCSMTRYLYAFGTVALLGLQLALVPSTWNPILTDISLQRERRELVRLIRSTSEPVLSDDMVLLRLAGHEVVWEPAIFAELASNGQWDEGNIIRLIERKVFAFIVTEGLKGDWNYDNRYNPDVDRAIETYYPFVETIAGYKVRRPSK